MTSKPKPQQIVLWVGLLLVTTCVLFPPRRSPHPQYYQLTSHKPGGALVGIHIPRVFLFSPGFSVAYLHDGTVLRAETDGGRLLAELVVLTLLTAGFYRLFQD